MNSHLTNQEKQISAQINKHTPSTTYWQSVSNSGKSSSSSYLNSYISVSVNDLKQFEVYDILHISKPINLFTTCLWNEFLQALQETLERQGEIVAYIEKKKKKKSKVTNWRKNASQNKICPK